MGSEKQAELSRIVAVRGCGHIAAFPNYEALVRGKDRCPVCTAAREKTVAEPRPREWEH